MEERDFGTPKQSTISLNQPQDPEKTGLPYTPTKRSFPPMLSGDLEKDLDSEGIGKISSENDIVPELPGTPTRPRRSRADTAKTVRLDTPNGDPPGTANTARKTGTNRSIAPPPLKRRETRLAQKEANPWQHIGLTLGGPMIILFDLVVPIIIYYTWYNKQIGAWETNCRADYPNQNPCPIPKPDFDKDIMGSAVASFGVGELWILVARVWRLFKHPDECAPLLSRSKWELDATSWVYGVAMIIALIPFVVGASLEIVELYLYGPSFIMGFLGSLMFITAFIPFKIPIGINSHARGSTIRPFIYYAAEDFMAVDGLQDREFRVRYNDRYETNRMFRRFFKYLTLWWLLGCCTYIGAMSAIIWTHVPFHYAFGAMLGLLFGYIAIWAATTYFWVLYEMKREHKAYEAGVIDASHAIKV